MKKCSPKGAIRPLIHVNKEVSCKSFRTERTRSSPDATASWRIEGAEESRQRGGWKKLRSERYWGSGPLDIIHSGKDSTLHWGREEVLSDFSSGGEVSSLNRLGSASLHCSEQTSWGHELTQKNCLRTEHSNPGRRQWRFGPEAHHGGERSGQVLAVFSGANARTCWFNGFQDLHHSWWVFFFF